MLSLETKRAQVCPSKTVPSRWLLVGCGSAACAVENKKHPQPSRRPYPRLVTLKWSVWIREGNKRLGGVMLVNLVV